MRNMKQVITGSVLAAMIAVSGAAMAAAKVTKESVEKEALALHPGATISSASETQHYGKQAWKVIGKEKDGKEFAVYYDAQTGKLMSEPAQKAK